MGTGVAESSLASLMVAALRRKYALGSKRKCSGRSLLLYYVCCFLVAGAYAKVEECRLLELELEREVTLTFPLF